ncbi:MAG: hypothetical protein FWG62_00750 [Proteobacteria bacterium]|nr:hypothetical protein [Pseudomonadota bacterium]
MLFSVIASVQHQGNIGFIAHRMDIAWGPCGALADFSASASAGPGPLLVQPGFHEFHIFLGLIANVLAIIHLHLHLHLRLGDACQSGYGAGRRHSRRAPQKAAVESFFLL